MKNFAIKIPERGKIFYILIAFLLMFFWFVFLMFSWSSYIKSDLKITNDQEIIIPVWPKSSTIASYGKKMVEKYEFEIIAASETYQLNPDLLRAVIFTEAATSHYYGLSQLLDILGLSTNQMPTNISSNLWSNLGGNNFNTSIPAQNIENAALLLKKIRETQDNPNHILAIGSLWHDLGTNHINKKGLQVDDAYRRRLWENNIPPGILNNPYDYILNKIYVFFSTIF